MALVSVNDGELDAPIAANGPALFVPRAIEYPVAPALADQTKATWLFPGVAATPLGVDGVNGAGGDELPPPHAANPSVDSASTANVDPGCASIAMGSSRGIGSMSTAAGLPIAKRFAFILRGIPGTNLIAIPY
jgi:hypothetical protein